MKVITIRMILIMTQFRISNDSNTFNDDFYHNNLISMN